MNKYSMLKTILLTVFIGLAGVQAGFAGNPANKTLLHDAMRSLWTEHVTWTRLYIVSALADLPDRAPTAERLMKNQSDIGEAIKPFFGEDAAEKFTSLLKAHITIAAEVISAAKMNEMAKQQEATKRWYANADEIAAFLSAANPSDWAAAEMKSMMREHLDLTTAEVVARTKSDWTADFAAYDKVRNQILKMADMISDGIIQKFPKNFHS